MICRMRKVVTISTFVLFAAVSLASAQCSSSSSSPIAKVLGELLSHQLKTVVTKQPIPTDYEVTRSTVNHVDAAFSEDGAVSYHYLRFNKGGLDFTKTYVLRTDLKVMPPGTSVVLFGWQTRYCPDRIVLSFFPPDSPVEGQHYANDWNPGTISLVLSNGYEMWPVERIVTLLNKIISTSEPTPPPPPVAPLRLPALYVTAQTPANQLHLNADNSFSLREGGQPYHGTFLADGTALELSINETGTKTSLSRKGDSLIDSSGQTWSYREQSAGTAPIEAVIHNEDIIKLARVGIDNATIIAKIKGSRCQFDTSTGALMLLKKSGISAAVVNAMVGAEQ